MTAHWPPAPLRWPGGPLSDGVVWLDGFRPSDAPLVARACDDPAVSRWLPVPSPYTEEDAHEFIGSRTAAAERGEELTFAVRDRAQDVLGAVAVHLGRCRTREAEIGYWTASWARGRGVASRASVLVARHAFTTWAPARIEFLVAVGNDASRAAARRAGAREEGVRRHGIAPHGERIDAWVLSLLPGDLHREAGPPPVGRRTGSDGR